MSGAARGPRRGLGVYRDVLAVPGAPVFVAAGLVARLPLSMLGIGVVLLVESAYGSYAVAGAVAAVYAVVSSVCSPLVARAVDRHGQARVMRPAIGVHLLGLSTLLVLVAERAPVAALLLAVVVMGSTVGSVGALVRARWLHVLERERGAVSPGGVPPPPGAAPPETPVAPAAAPGAGAGPGGDRADDGFEGRVHSALSLESVLDEVVFAVGPLLVATLATTVSPVVGLVVAGAAVGGGGAVLLAQRGTEPPPVPGRAPVGSAVLRARGVVELLAVFAAAGTVFGAVEVVVVAFTEARGAPAAAGVVLALYAVGSLLAGLAYGAVRWSSSAGRRFTTAAVLFAAGVLPVALVPLVPAGAGVPALAAVLLVAGSAISPTLIAGTALVRELVQPSRLTEGLTWVATSLGLGVALGAALGGWWVDAAGPASALRLPALAGLAAVVVVLAGRARLLPRSG